jgi:hypothetical protein
MEAMPPTMDQNGLASQLLQLAPTIKRLVDSLKPVIDQPIIRFPYTMPVASSLIVGAGQRNIFMPSADFNHSLEWPFEIHKVKFSNDPSHTFRDWRVFIKDQSFNQDWHKFSTMVDLLIEQNTSQWPLSFPWVVRPKGGGLSVSVDNLDDDNPITVDINFEGFLLIPRS